MLIVGFFAAVFGGAWLSVFNDTVQNWSGVDNLFSLTTALFMTFWLIGWSIGTFSIVTAFIIMLAGRQVVLVHSGRMEIILGIIGLGFKINLRATEVLNAHLTDADSSKGSKTGRQIKIETDGGGKNSPFGRNMTERDLAKFKFAIDCNRSMESGLGDMPSSAHESVDDEPSSQPQMLLNDHSETHTDIEASEPDAPLTLTSPSTLLLIFANLVPLLGVVFFGWDLGSTMVLYWAENPQSKHHGSRPREHEKLLLQNNQHAYHHPFWWRRRNDFGQRCVCTNIAYCHQDCGGRGCPSKTICKQLRRRF